METRPSFLLYTVALGPMYKRGPGKGTPVLSWSRPRGGHFRSRYLRDRLAVPMPNTAFTKMIPKGPLYSPVKLLQLVFLRKENIFTSYSTKAFQLPQKCLCNSFAPKTTRTRPCLYTQAQASGHQYSTGSSTNGKTLNSRVKLVLMASGVGSLGYFLYRVGDTTKQKKRTAKGWQISLYRRMPLKAVSRMWGKFNKVELPMFLRKPILGLYIWMFGCNLEEAQVQDLKHYRNLGEFFRRTLKPHVRPIDDDHVLTSPADGKILYYGQVRHGILEQVKGVTYSLRGFLGPQTWDSAHHGQDINHQSDEEFQSDLFLKPGNELHHCIIYLAPGDYHRFHSPASWVVKHRRHFPGELLSVNPGVARWVQGLFNFNERAVYTGQWEHGFFSMAAVGATNVGSIKIYCDEELETNVRGKYPEYTYFDKKFPKPFKVDKGDMFGEFNLGSTIVLIFEAPKGFEFKIKEGQKIKFGRPVGNVS